VDLVTTYKQRAICKKLQSWGCLLFLFFVSLSVSVSIACRCKIDDA